MPPRQPVGGRPYAMFGRRVGRARVDLNLKAQDVAERVGVGKNTVYSWEQGKTVPHRARLASLAETLELDVNELEDIIASDRQNTRDQPRTETYARSEPVGDTNQLLLELGALRLDIRQTEPIYVHVTIGPITPQPRTA